MSRLLKLLKWIVYGIATLVLLTLVSLQSYKVYLRNATSIETPNGISSLEEVTLGGIKQWIFIRGTDRSNPLLLYLHGGPGEPVMGMSTSRTLDTDLINHFTVVHWDQRGAGKSYRSDIPVESMSISSLVDDCNELIDQLRTRFGAPKVFLVGHSAGTTIGLKMAHRYPEKIHAYVGVSQIVNDYAQQRLSYELAVAQAASAGDTDAENALRAIGPPPYDSPDEIFDKAAYIVRYGGIIHSNPVSGLGNLILGYFTSPEYSLSDAWNTATRKGLNFTTKARWAEIQRVDFTQEISSLQVPVYFLVGRHDMINPTVLVEDYFDRLDAERGKHLVTFEHSAHMVIVEENGKYQDTLINLVLPEATAASSHDPDGDRPDILGTVAVPVHRCAKCGRRPLPKTFPRVDIVHEIDEGDCQCGECRAELVPVTEKVTEQLDIEPYAYLRTVFTELPQATSVDKIEALLPVPRDSVDSAQVS